MKRIFFIITLILTCAIFSVAQVPSPRTTKITKRLTPLQTKAKKEIFTSLKNYGTNISDEGDETLSFKSDGTTYLVSIKSLNSQTLYLFLATIFGLPEDFDSELSIIAAFNAAGGKPVCSFASNGGVAFSCEMYAKDSKPFITVLPEMIMALKESFQAFPSEYEKLKEAGLDTSGRKYSSVKTPSANEYIYPKTGLKGDKKLYLTKVSITPQNTILDMTSYNDAQFQNCGISKNAYIVADGKKYEMIKAEGISYLPQYTDYPYWDTGREVSLSFKLFFPPIPLSTDKIDFYEGVNGGWDMKNIELKHGNIYQINGERIETAYHKWDCTGIEIQDGQTILTKTVQPKSENTFMYSSQDEFIEDAETGRKYYLQNSSIGFEGSPEFSDNTKIITFYEVYPALPLQVKKINISTGSQYYIKDLLIR